jgi:serine/threonine protein kinase
VTPYRGLPAGTSLNGIYAIDQLIGAGGMGEVYRGHEVQTGATVAIKMLLPDMAENEAALALFRREAAALLNLHHDAIVRYFLFTVEPTLQRPYLAMEFIDGRSLSDILETGPLPYEEVVGLVRRVATGFHVAHERGLVHRDVSPDNIILPRGGVSRAKIIDFGIARSTAVGDPTIIGDGFAGKHNFVSPEQVGLYGHNVTFKSDIYSFGLVLFYAATGRKLDMGGSQFQLVEKRRSVPDLSQIDPRLQPLLERMLQPDPTERPASMADIAAWSLPDGLAAVPTPPPARLVSPLRSNGSPDPRKSVRRRDIQFRSLVASIALCLIGSGVYAFYVLVWSDTSKGPPLPPPKLNQNASLPKSEPTQPARPQESAKQPETQAALPKTPSPTTTLPANRLESIRSYLDQYKGGDCFLIVPVAIGQRTAILEGFGSSPGPFDTFAQDFRGEQGFNASVGIRQIAQPQCPAIKFVNELHVDRARAPRINLDNVELKGGDMLSGSVENFSNRTIELLLITDDGQVQNLSSLLKPGTDSMSFTIGLQGNKADAAPQLLMAIASSRALESLRSSQPVAADIFFPQALKDAKEAKVPVTATARFFKLQK